MKKAIFAAGILAVFTLSGCDFDLDDFLEANPTNATVAQAKGLRDGSYVILTGVIDAHLFGEYYSFSDSTGSVNVEIENSVWARAGINPATLTFPVPFEILGEVDKEPGGVTIEAERVKML